MPVTNRGPVFDLMTAVPAAAGPTSYFQLVLSGFGCRFGAASSCDSEGAAPGEHGNHRPSEEIEIETDGPVLDVEEVHADRLVERHVRTT
jgi:hypothetical protein